MKRKIEDYKNKLVAIFCSSIEEWNKINDLLGKKGLTRDYGDISAPDNTFVDCIHINGIGTASKKYYEQQTYAIHLSSDFLEKESKFEEGRWYKNYNPPNYMKCNKVDSNYMYGVEYISDGVYNKHSNSMYSWDLKTQTLVTDLEEIQEFLPLNHPDKIVKLTSFPLEGCVYDDSGLLVWEIGCYYKLNFTDNTSTYIKLSKKVDDRIYGNEYTDSTGKWYYSEIIWFTKQLKSYEKVDKLNQKEEPMFKKDNYIICLNNVKGKEGVANFCYKLIKDQDNINSPLFFEKHRAISIPEHQIRYATSKEIAKYNELGRSFDVTTLVKTNEKVKSLLEEAKERYPIGTKFKSVVTRNLFIVESHVNEAKNSNIAFHTIESNSSGNHWGCVYENGTWAEIVSLPNEQVQKEKSLVEQVRKGLKLKDRWLKCIKKCDWENITIGEYVQILGNHSICPWVKKKDSKEQNFLDLGRIDREEFELMPEDFSPNEEKEWIPLTSDCIMYNGENISKGFEVSSYYEFDGKSFNQDIYIPSITKKSKKLQTITIESTTDLNLGLTKIKSKQIQTIKI